MIKNTKYIILLCIIALAIISCENEKRFPPNGYIPNTPKATEQLEAQYFWTPQDKISSAYWKDANYVQLSLSNLEIENLYGDGYLNMTGTYNGTTDFNNGIDPQATIKAGYDDTYIYFLVEWKDTSANASYQSWLWEGSEDKLKSDVNSEWTSQRNQDNLTLLFDTDNSSVKDAWHWSLAYTAIFDMALNVSADENGTLITPTNVPYIRNAANNTSRIGPLYEWNGERQEVTLSNGTVKVLDPAYYLSDEYKIPFTGDIKAGQDVFNNTASCKLCHGNNGDGIVDEYGSDGGSLNRVFTNKYSREGLRDFIKTLPHEGANAQYWGKIANNPTAQENLIAFLRGIAGVPGHTLKYSSDFDEIEAISNIAVGGISSRNSKYQVLFKRKLESINSEDVSFTPENIYTFSIRFSDNDEINFVGVSNIELIFKSNTL